MMVGRFSNPFKVIGICPHCDAKIKFLERQVKKKIKKAIKKSPPELKLEMEGKEKWCCKCLLDYLEPKFKEFYSTLPPSQLKSLNPLAKKLMRRALKVSK